MQSRSSYSFSHFFISCVIWVVVFSHFTSFFPNAALTSTTHILLGLSFSLYFLDIASNNFLVNISSFIRFMRSNHYSNTLLLLLLLLNSSSYSSYVLCFLFSSLFFKPIFFYFCAVYLLPLVGIPFITKDSNPWCFCEGGLHLLRWP